QDQGAPRTIGNGGVDQCAGNENCRERLRKRGWIPGKPNSVRMPAMASQSTVSCRALSRLRAALSGVIACDPSVERWQRTVHSVGAPGKQRKNARVIEDSAYRLQQTCAPSAPVMLGLVFVRLQFGDGGREKGRRVKARGLSVGDVFGLHVYGSG